MTHPPALALYRAASRALAPALSPWLALRAAAGKEDWARLGERAGRASAPRPPGRLVWLHGASVGELGVVLQVRAGLATRAPDLSFLVTTGTRTSAELFSRRAPDAIHQYAPLDRASAARRFLAHWRPSLGVFIESELWPNLAFEAQAAGVPLALVNARVSERTIASWRRMRVSMRRVLAAFDPIIAADARTADALRDVAGRDVVLAGNLKLAAAAPAFDAAALAALRSEIGDRPVWVASSTHEGEEEILAAAHDLVRARAPNALLILAVRHPERGERVAARLGSAPRRSRGEPIGAAPIYVVDTIGEMGLFYAAASVAFIAGSLRPDLRGHNPVEPAQLDAAILHGPYVSSFADVYEALSVAQATRRADTAHAIAHAVHDLWADEASRAAMTGAARRVVAQGGPSLEQTIDALCARLAFDSAGARAHAST